ncbi:MAG: hypothetical protein ACQESR_30190 [Planctomycetota bacterium]
MLDAIVDSLVHAARFNPEDQVAPTMILWTDSERQWAPLIPRLQERLPELLGANKTPKWPVHAGGSEIGPPPTSRLVVTPGHTRPARHGFR